MHNTMEEPEKRRDFLSIGARVSVSRYTAVILIVVFFAVSSTWIYNLNNRAIGSAHVDEWHTLILGSSHLDPFTKPVPTVRVGETNRWFVRLLYPGAVYYMNSHMGGEHYLTGWKYPGGFYLKEHFNAVDAVQRDPNIQDFVFFMRVAFGLLAVCCFCLVLWALFSRFGLAAAAAYGSLILSSPLVLEQFQIFYSETTLFVVFNLAAFLCLRREMSSYRMAAYLGILSAAALSTKLTGIMIVAALFAYIIFNRRQRRQHEAEWCVEIYLLSLLAFLVLINWPSGSVFNFVNQTLSNVYHFKTGHRVTAEGGVDFLLTIFRDLGYLTVSLFLISLLWLARSPRRGLAWVYVLAIGVVFVVGGFSNTAIYSERNLASVCVAMSFVIAICVGDFVGGYLANKTSYRVVSTAGLVLVFVVSAASLVYGLPSLGGTFFEKNREFVRNCNDMATIGLSNSDLRSLQQSTNVTIATFPSIRGPFNVSTDYERLFGKYRGYTCLVVRREGQTKQATNFFLPDNYSLETRVGDLFLFGSIRDP